MSLLVIFLCLLVVFVSNIFIWWSVFLFMTMFFIFLNKGYVSYSSMINYFVLQESLGLLFLLLFFSFFPFFIIMMKIGLAPFHFWLFKVVGSMYGLNLIWFLTIHKIPFLLVYLQLFNFSFFFVLFIGLLFCLFQMFVIKSFKNLLVLSSVESLNWVIMGLVMSFFNVFFLFFYYYLMMGFVIFFFDKSFSYLSFSWELVLFFMNMPFSFSFFIKIFFLMEILKSFGFFFLSILFLMFLSILSLSFWLLFLSTKLNFYNKYNFSIFSFYFPFMFLVII